MKGPRSNPLIKFRPMFAEQSMVNACGRVVEALVDLELMAAANLRHHPRVVMRFGQGATVEARAGVDPGVVEVHSTAGAKVLVHDASVHAALNMLAGAGIVIRDVGVRGRRRPALSHEKETRQPRARSQAVAK